jgi:hypothetical protein
VSLQLEFQPLSISSKETVMALAAHEVQQLNQAIQTAMRAVRAGGAQQGYGAQQAGYGAQPGWQAGQLGGGFARTGRDGSINWWTCCATACVKAFSSR